MSQKFNVGDPVHVEFDGRVYEYPGEFMQNTVSPNHVAVSANGFIHHIHRASKDITKEAPPRPEVEVGQVWCADDRSFLVFADFGEGGASLCGANPYEVVRQKKFFEKYPDAQLATVTLPFD